MDTMETDEKYSATLEKEKETQRFVSIRQQLQSNKRRGQMILREKALKIIKILVQDPLPWPHKS